MRMIFLAFCDPAPNESRIKYTRGLVSNFPQCFVAEESTISKLKTAYHASEGD